MEGGSCVTPSVLLVAGFPGSGKTTYITEMGQGGWHVLDDFKANAFDNSPEFRKSRYCASLLACLRAGGKCVVADIDFCRTEARAEAEKVLREGVPDVAITWCYFSYDVQACETNIKHRNRPSLQEDLKKLYECAAHYRIPHGADVRACYRRP